MGIRLVNTMKMHAASMDAQVGQARWGVVQSVDPVRYVAKVLIQPENVLSGWLPVMSPFVGGGFGLVSPPVIGQQVSIVADSGDHQHGIIIGGTWSSSSPTPGPAKAPTAAGAAVQSGEAALFSKTGSYVLLNNDGSLFISSSAGSYVFMAPDSTMTIQDRSGSSIKFLDNGCDPDYRKRYHQWERNRRVRDRRSGDVARPPSRH